MTDCKDTKLVLVHEASTHLLSTSPHCHGEFLFGEVANATVVEAFLLCSGAEYETEKTRTGGLTTRLFDGVTFNVDIPQYCIDERRNSNGTLEAITWVCPPRGGEIARAALILALLSSVFVTFLLIPLSPQRKRLPGKIRLINVGCLLFTTFSGCVTFDAFYFGVSYPLCLAAGVQLGSIYWGPTAFFWLNVMRFELWWNLSKRCVLQTPPCYAYNYRESDGSCQLVLNGKSDLVEDNGFTSYVQRLCLTEYPKIQKASVSFEDWSGEYPAPPSGRVVLRCLNSVFSDGSQLHTAECSSALSDSWCSSFKEETIT
ncbi:unnamed protein product [Darwinula stevensoni]|uniref:Uncharacterized protein n=1 Tax=Darwinula stevensoni TaxID=69355 RepID=A0A7R8X953_9CRUS|nr:unnamed protein product [Darwinula stevensoni]CAG0888820.1 unnamed protein product [Darwinula stevensoni]